MSEELYLSEIARLALQVDRSTDVNEIILRLHETVVDLSKYHRKHVQTGDENTWVAHHSITRYLALKLRNVCCPSIFTGDIGAMSRAVVAIMESENEIAKMVRPLARPDSASDSYVADDSSKGL